MAQRKKAGVLYQLRVDLDDIRPPIWRRILVPGNTKLSALSEILIASMGWYGYHLHQFIAEGGIRACQRPLQPGREITPVLDCQVSQRFGHFAILLCLFFLHHQGCHLLAVTW